ncbi:MAG: hypothetical protein PHE51_00635 [Eubacteriales bacterium]|nr:hypothetical protein [Eubacteriales bacterium]
MAKNIEDKKTGNTKKIILYVVASVLIVSLLAGGYFLFLRDYVEYYTAVEEIEDGDLDRGFDRLMGIAKRTPDYRDTNALVYAFALELIDTSDKKNKQRAYKMLDTIKDYEYATEIMYYLWVEDVYDPQDDTSFEMADQFIQMIPEDYEGPYAKEVVKYRNDIKKSLDELNQKKYEAAMSDEFSE